MTTDLSSFFKGGFDATKYIKKPTPWGAENPRADFITAMRQHGYRPDNMLVIGQVTRIPDSQDKGHDKTGWYVYFEIENQGSDSTFGVGVFGTWRDPDSKTRWSSKQESYKTDVERELEASKMAKYMAERERDKADLQRVAAEAAKQAFDSAEPADPKHDYLKKKGIKAHGVKQRDGHLIIPMYDDSGEIMSYQSISADGTKRFKKDAKKKGGFFPIDGAKDVIFITTGFATGATIAEATGMMTFVSFDDGNLPEVASAVRARYGLSQRIVIASDDDIGKPQNSGRTAGTKTAILINAEVKFPTTPTDFNDMAAAEGIKAVRDLLLTAPEPEAKDEQKPAAVGKITPSEQMALNPSGAIALIAGYYNATASKSQPMFAVQTALAICSVVLARSYRTDQNNLSSLFFLNIAKSGGGKEHIETTIKTILADAGRLELLSGSGYNSSNAVMASLYVSPRHITVIDEFGRYLKAANNMANGYQMGANTALMSAITKLSSDFSLANYSAGGALDKDSASKVTNKRTQCPAITLVGSTTDSTFFNAISGDSVKDGFLNRFIIAISNEGRIRPVKTKIMQTPQPIIDWIDRIMYRAGNQIHIHNQKPSFIDVQFHDECDDLLFGEMIDYPMQQQDLLETFGIEEMPSRLREWAMRLSLIVALSDDPDAEFIRLSHLQWAWNYVLYHYTRSIAEIKMRVSGSRHEADKKKILAAIRAAGNLGVKQNQMPKRPPFSEYKKKDLQEILTELNDSMLVECVVEAGKAGGRPTTVWKSYDSEIV